MPEPLHRWVPEYDGTYGEIAAEVGADLGLPPDDDQRDILDAIFAFRRSNPDVPAFFRVGVVGPRQNIKTSTLEVAALTDLFVFRVSLHIWTAHLFMAAKGAFVDMCNRIEANPDYSRLCKRPRRANGDLAIVLKTGEEIQFHARSTGGGRSRTAAKVTLDEGLFLVPTDLGALLPTMATLPDAQVRIASSGGMVGSEVLRDVRDEGRGGTDLNLAYFEWGAPVAPCANPTCDHRAGRVEGCALDDPELRAQANPALGRRISVTALDNFRAAMPADEFAREFLTWWEDPVDGGVDGISAEDWAARADEDAVLAKPPTLALDGAPNLASACIAACGGPVYVAKHQRGASWVPAALRTIVDQQGATTVGLDPSGPIGALLPDLEQAGFTIRSDDNPDGLLVLLSGTEMVQACGALYASVVDKETADPLVHRDQPILNDAVAGAGRRMVGDAWKWSRKDSTQDISPLVAVTIARFLWRQPAVESLDWLSIDV